MPARSDRSARPGRTTPGRPPPRWSPPPARDGAATGPWRGTCPAPVRCPGTATRPAARTTRPAAPAATRGQRSHRRPAAGPPSRRSARRPGPRPPPCPRTAAASARATTAAPSPPRPTGSGPARSAAPSRRAAARRTAPAPAPGMRRPPCRTGHPPRVTVPGPAGYPPVHRVQRQRHRGERDHHRHRDLVPVPVNESATSAVRPPISTARVRVTASAGPSRVRPDRATARTRTWRSAPAVRDADHRAGARRARRCGRAAPAAAAAEQRPPRPARPAGAPGRVRTVGIPPPYLPMPTCRSVRSPWPRRRVTPYRDEIRPSAAFGSSEGTAAEDAIAGGASGCGEPGVGEIRECTVPDPGPARCWCAPCTPGSAGAPRHWCSPAWYRRASTT